MAMCFGKLRNRATPLAGTPWPTSTDGAPPRRRTCSPRGLRWTWWLPTDVQARRCFGRLTENSRGRRQAPLRRGPNSSCGTCSVATMPQRALAVRWRCSAAFRGKHGRAAWSCFTTAQSAATSFARSCPRTSIGWPHVGGRAAPWMPKSDRDEGVARRVPCQESESAASRRILSLALISSISRWYPLMVFIAWSRMDSAPFPVNRSMFSSVEVMRC